MSVRDPHFSQGDGEITFCGAIEMGGFNACASQVITDGMRKYGRTASGGSGRRRSVSGLRCRARSRGRWHDRAVANAAEAWLHEPRATVAYTRLVDAVLRRRAWLRSALDDTPAAPMSLRQRPEALDEVGADLSTVRFGDDLPRDPRALVDPGSSAYRAPLHPTPTCWSQPRRPRLLWVMRIRNDEGARP